MQQILVIKLSALGDLVLAFAACATIRHHHPADRITLLTTRPFADLARASPYFDDVLIDSRPRLSAPAALLAGLRQMRRPRFDRVYDLQTSDRSALYFWMMRRWDGGPVWSGTAPGCAHRHTNPNRRRMHTLERQADQLAVAGLCVPDPPPLPDLSWVDAPLADLDLPAPTGSPNGTGAPNAPPLALLVPGASAHRPEKRWPADQYADLARHFADRGLVPVVLGGEPERAAAATIARACPAALDRVGRTSLLQIASLGRRAALAVGNDTGPMHLLAAAGCPSLVLFSRASDPARCAPRGRRVAILRVEDLADLPQDPVQEAAAALLAGEADADADAGPPPC